MRRVMGNAMMSDRRGSRRIESCGSVLDRLGVRAQHKIVDFLLVRDAVEASVVIGLKLGRANEIGQAAVCIGVLRQLSSVFTEGNYLDLEFELGWRYKCRLGSPTRLVVRVRVLNLGHGDLKGGLH